MPFHSFLQGKSALFYQCRVLPSISKITLAGAYLTSTAALRFGENLPENSERIFCYHILSIAKMVSKYICKEDRKRHVKSNVPYNTFHFSLLPVQFGQVGQRNASEKTTHLFTLETIRITQWVLLTSDVNIEIFCIKWVALCVSKVFAVVYFIFDTFASFSDKGTEEYCGCK